MAETTVPRVVLGMPGYGAGTAGAFHGYWRATRLPEADILAGTPGVAYCYREGSLLASNFNRLWADALNFAHKLGWRPDYFAMIHSDIEPQDWWLDTLIAELEARGLDVLGVAAPMKDFRGLTTTALARPDGDTWRPLCRLSLSEVHRLPETFTSEDVGHPILLNTGLWVCRFDPAWARKVHFTINDRIVFDTGLDEYVVQEEPEDWFFSRLLHEVGLKIGCTRKIHLNHRGPANFTNAAPWGEPFDSIWLKAPVIPERIADPDGFVFPHDIDGWLSHEEGRELYELARGRRVLEIGSYCGRSTVCLAQSADSVVAVDPFDGRATPAPGDTFDRFLTSLSRYGVAGKVTAAVGTVADAPSGPFDLAFIDGAHDRESVEADIAGALARLAPGGLLAFHDYRTRPGDHDGRWDPGVTAAVDSLVASGGEILRVSGTVAVVRPPAEVFQPLEV